MSILSKSVAVAAFATLQNTSYVHALGAAQDTVAPATSMRFMRPRVAADVIDSVGTVAQQEAEVGSAAVVEDNTGVRAYEVRMAPTTGTARTLWRRLAHPAQAETPRGTRNNCTHASQGSASKSTPVKQRYTRYPGTAEHEQTPGRPQQARNSRNGSTAAEVIPRMYSHI